MAATSITHGDVVPDTGEQGWHRLADFPAFKKWQYKDTPYRVIADLGPRGHWRAIFTTWYGTQSYTIKGNLGSGGKWDAIASARKFMQENKYGCAPPGEYNEN